VEKYKLTQTEKDETGEEQIILFGIKGTVYKEFVLTRQTVDSA
jgi:hypothetical protein